MAITLNHYAMLKHLHKQGVLPQGGPILEIGQANVYGDVARENIVTECIGFIASEERRRHWGRELTATLTPENSLSQLFLLVRFLYEALFDARDITSIDMDPNAPNATRKDLNEIQFDPAYDSQYKVAYNHGTAEHIFEIARVFRYMHDATHVGGLMIHEGPFTGWIDHGFYGLQPTLFWDVAAANHYTMVTLATFHMPSSTITIFDSREELLKAAKRDQLPAASMLFAAMRKNTPAPFRVPRQHIYSGGDVSAEAATAWSVLR